MTRADRAALVLGSLSAAFWAGAAAASFLRPQPRPVDYDADLGPCRGHNRTHCGRCRA